MEHIQTKAVGIGVLAFLAASFPVLGAPTYEPPSKNSIVASIQLNSLLGVSSPASPERVADSTDFIITAYASVPEETDDTPFITAYGTRVRPGIVATNDLPYGTRIRIPALFGDKVLTVEDRMAQRKRFQIDIWLPTPKEAKNFGVQYADVEILER